MNKKIKTYLLLTGVLCIWGTIAYKIINGINPSPPKEIEQSFNMAFNLKRQSTIDTFSISEVKRDPFLGAIETKRTTLKQIRNSKSIKAETLMPNIIYGGLIQKQNSKSRIYVVNINNQQYLLKQGQTVSDVKLINGNEESIIISFKGKNYTIKL